MNLKKLSQKGFTIVEVLMTVLVISMVVSVVGGGVTVVRNAYVRITLKAEAETLRSTALTEVIDELRFAQNIKVENPDNPENSRIVFESQNRGYRMYFTSDDEGIKVNSLPKVSDSPLPLLTDKTMSNKLVPQITTLEYDVNSEKFKLRIEIFTKDSGGNLSDQPLVRMDEADAIIIKPVNAKK